MYRCEQPNRLLVEVEDECGGLPPGAIDDLFRPFVRRTRKGPGTGLGVSIARRAVETLDGEVRARDLPGKGCIFSIDLPRAFVSAAEHEHPAAPQGHEPAVPP